MSIKLKGTCMDCNIKIHNKEAKRCRKCYYIYSKTHPRKITLEGRRRISKSKLAEKNPNWKGGKCDEYYKRRVKKENCSDCGRKNVWLEVHHKDGDHFNNNPNNWAVLCRKCHMIKDGRYKKLGYYSRCKNKTTPLILNLLEEEDRLTPKEMSLLLSTHIRNIHRGLKVLNRDRKVIKVGKKVPSRPQNTAMLWSLADYQRKVNK